MSFTITFKGPWGSQLISKSMKIFYFFVIVHCYLRYNVTARQWDMKLLKKLFHWINFLISNKTYTLIFHQTLLKYKIEIDIGRIKNLHDSIISSNYLIDFVRKSCKKTRIWVNFLLLVIRWDLVFHFSVNIKRPYV